jgi:hypothetical protein
MEDVRELPALAEQYFLAEDENSCGASGAHSTRYTIVNQTWKVFPVNGYQVKLDDPDFTFGHRSGVNRSFVHKGMPCGELNDAVIYRICSHSPT